MIFSSSFFCEAVEHDSTLENTPSLSLQSLTEEEKVCTVAHWLIYFQEQYANCLYSVYNVSYSISCSVVALKSVQ